MNRLKNRSLFASTQWNRPHPTDAHNVRIRKIRWPPMCLCCFSNTCLRKDKLLDCGLRFTNHNKMAVCLRKVDALIVLLSLLHAVKSEEKLISEVLKEPPSDCSRYASLPFRYIFAWVNLSCKIYLVFFYKHSVVFLKPPLRRRLCNVLQPFFDYAWYSLVSKS